MSPNRAFLAVAVAVIGCGSSEGGSSAAGPTGPIALADYPAAYADAVCGLLQPCCASASLAFDLAHCKAAYAAQAQKDIALFADAIYDPDRGGACVSAFRALGGTCATTAAQKAAADAACSAVTVGRIALGGACISDLECATGHCGQDGKGGPSVCVADPYAAMPPAAGAACTGWCDVPGPGSCTPLLATGAVCLVSTGLVCGEDQTCVALPDTGAPCPNDVCAADAYCDDSKHCVARVPLGGACSNVDLLETCADGGYCVGKVCVATEPVADPISCSGPGP